MNNAKAYRALCLAILFNLGVALAMLVAMFGWDGWSVIMEFPLCLTVGITSLFLTARFAAPYLNRSARGGFCRSGFAGALALLIILLAGTLAGTTAGFLSMGVADGTSATFGDKIFDYYVKPFYWIMIFGVFPTLLTGAVTGLLFRQNLTRNLDTNG